jgi:transcriptional regulator NrdR family protein
VTCVSCRVGETVVYDSRPDGLVVKRKRRCLSCGARFVTSEMVTNIVRRWAKP